ncbi:MAG: hypothetical protein Q8O72_09985, partial [Bacteroidales bacterium]|nr:hypothetical protein [Bacteroidales bacterium]
MFSTFRNADSPLPQAKNRATHDTYSDNVFVASQRRFSAYTSQKHEFYYTSHFKNSLLKKVDFWLAPAIIRALNIFKNSSYEHSKYSNVKNSSNAG